MVSQAHTTFDKNREDVDRLRDIHTDITGEGPGRKWKVEALHKSAIVLLTAFWEAFCEDLAAEALEHLVSHASDAGSLPLELQKRVAKELKGDSHELAVWGLADQGWRAVLKSRLARLQEERNRRLNTPKTQQINDLFHDAVGISDIAKRWYWSGMSAKRAAEKLDEFVTLRGAIAHRGTAASSVTKDQVNDYYNHVQRIVAPTERQVAKAIEQATGTAPWS
jgi:RiboL-PSP-HEPN